MKNIIISNFFLFFIGISSSSVVAMERKKGESPRSSSIPINVLGLSPSSNSGSSLLHIFAASPKRTPLPSPRKRERTGSGIELKDSGKFNTDSGTLSTVGLDSEKHGTNDSYEALTTTDSTDFNNSGEIMDFPSSYYSRQALSRQWHTLSHEDRKVEMMAMNILRIMETDKETRMPKKQLNEYIGILKKQNRFDVVYNLLNKEARRDQPELIKEQTIECQKALKEIFDQYVKDQYKDIACQKLKKNILLTCIPGQFVVMCFSFAIILHVMWQQCGF